MYHSATSGGSVTAEQTSALGAISRDASPPRPGSDIFVEVQAQPLSPERAPADDEFESGGLRSWLVCDLVCFFFGFKRCALSPDSTCFSFDCNLPRLAPVSVTLSTSV
jgi:hypothetical protein